MNNFFYIFLFIFWTMFGSFASVIIYRLKSGEWWMWVWRSHCKTCERDLTALELVPIFSWLFQGWKCKGCKQKIDAIYPLLEMTMWVLFLAVWYFLITPELVFSWDFLELVRLDFLLGIIFFTVIYVFYDILYLEIPESILILANLLALSMLVWQWFWYSFIPYLPVWGLDFITLWICLSILWALYYIMLAGLKELYDCLILIWVIVLLVWYMNTAELGYNSSALISGTIATLAIFISFFLQIVLSEWRWMGAGDLRIAILMGLLVWASFAFPAWMITYLIWSIVGVWVICWSKIKNGFKADFEHQIPFGPFLACWYLTILFFHPHISKIIESYF